MIVCLDPNEQRGGIYEVLAPLYFPRDPLEEQSALWQLPKDVGGAYGEPQLADRQIRIIHNPQHAVMIEGKRKWDGCLIDGTLICSYTLHTKDIKVVQIRVPPGATP